MNESCPFCTATVSTIKIHRFVLRICPKCFSTFFSSNKTMSFRQEISDATRNLWLKSLKEKDLKDPPYESIKCLDHGEVLIDAKLPDYGIDAKVTTCCDLFHLTPSLTMQILERTLQFPSHKNAPKKHIKHHFFFIRALDKILSKFFAEDNLEEDPFEFIQYDHHFKDILGPRL